MTSATGRKTNLVAVLPTSMTLGNAVCGFAAISYATQADVPGAGVHPLCAAGISILAAMLLDGLDGAVARMTRQTSEFGAQLDSLCDLVSFGIAPAVLLVHFPSLLPSRLVWCIALLYVLCAALRLAKFNADRGLGPSSDSFFGLPTPAAAGVVASLTLVWPGLRTFAADAPSRLRPIAERLEFLAPAVLPWLVLLLAALMVSSIRYPHYLKQLLAGKRPLLHLVEAYFALAAVFVVHELALPLVFLAFAFASPLRALMFPLAARMARSTQLVFSTGR